jgi:hypothetical protein
LTLPEVRFAKNGDVSLAYQVVGEGEIDLVFVPGFIWHALAGWEEPRHARFLRRLVIMYFAVLRPRSQGLGDQSRIRRHRNSKYHQSSV